VRGQVELRTALLDLREVARHGLQTSQPFVAEREHQLEADLPAGPVWVDVDAGRIEQVITNLLTNAARYTDPGGHIWLTLATEGAEAVLRVRDSGIGIAPQVLPGIFDLFEQGRPRELRSRGGLGLGLTLVRRRVELHGGSVAAHSDGAGQGSEFTARLPLADAPREWSGG
jgi:signal transduction histidine kinase